MKKKKKRFEDSLWERPDHLRATILLLCDDDNDNNNNHNNAAHFSESFALIYYRAQRNFPEDSIVHL
jgi:hypothetical protein